MEPVSNNPTDAELRSLEASIKRTELEVRKLELQNALRAKSGINWTIFIPVMSGLLLIASAMVSGIIERSKSLTIEEIKASNQLALEQKRLETNLILESSKTNDPAKAAANLRFFVATGHISDPEGKIAALTAEGKAPVLPSLTNLPPGEKRELSKLIRQENVELLVVSSVRRIDESRWEYSYEILNLGSAPVPVIWKEILLSHVGVLPGEELRSNLQFASPPEIITTTLDFGPDRRSERVEAFGFQELVRQGADSKSVKK